ncbi:MAG: UbiX family flavin prenyltransferase [Dissulfurimicrobium sp.]|uniref:UbiX family flavin prenyltransferase n=1 Tax=Dissulfurimicrobium sp. TaxID=2022436 RepID=UPI00404AB2B4
MAKRTDKAPVLLAVTGASGAIYSLKFMEIMKDLGQEVHLIISKAGVEVIRLELGDEGYDILKDMANALYQEDDLAARPASGGTKWHAMVILPCTMGTLASVAHGISRNLIHRAADCFLKEGRTLVLAPRETPFNRTHLRNMLLAAESGAVIYPAMPSFYHKPADLDEMASFFAGRIAEFLGFEVKDLKRWKGKQTRCDL